MADLKEDLRVVSEEAISEVPATQNNPIAPLVYLIPLICRKRERLLRPLETLRLRLVPPSLKWFEGPLPPSVPIQTSHPDDLRASLKHGRSPESNEVCKRCLIPGHKIDECRHQLTCRRCFGIGHCVERCPLKSPQTDHSKGKRLPMKPLLHVPVHRPSPSTSLLRVLLPIFEAIIQSKEALKKNGNHQGYILECKCSIASCGAPDPSQL
ncbi:Zinc finger CCHC-type protein [Dioscorea alata]|uniref:Zinc finger CCHC-type protein n=1 Tax=Dioscorea alata TaxID=55571 RepID=A0ACB7VKF4_DIOAL|nr:Zinc finger CCHC-type protein [Dioscorea alata]